MQERNDNAQPTAHLVKLDGRGTEVARAATNQELELRARSKFVDGSIVESLVSGRRYTLEHVRPGHIATMRRELPKVKGKAARKAEKRARRARGFTGLL